MSALYLKSAKRGLGVLVLCFADTPEIPRVTPDKIETEFQWELAPFSKSPLLKFLFLIDVKQCQETRTY